MEGQKFYGKSFPEQLDAGSKSVCCPDCRQIILPVPERAEGVLDTMERKLSAMGDKIEAVQKRWEAQRSQTKEQKKKKEFGTKDPWEL